MKYTKRQLYEETGKLYAFLRSHPKKIILKKLNRMHGTYDYGTDEVELDYRRELIPTIIHESLHYYHPELSETDILKKEKNIINQLSIQQIRNIIKKLGKVL